MNISKALKEKNKIAKQYKNILFQMSAYNSTVASSPVYFDVKKLASTAEELRNKLIQLKTDIHYSTQPVRKEIFKLSELKSYLNILQNLNTTEGETSDYRGTVTKYVVQITEIEKLNMIKEVEERIEQLQDVLDSFNASTPLTSLAVELPF